MPGTIEVPTGEASVKEAGNQGKRVTSGQAETEVALLTGGYDPPYAYGLAMALSSMGVRVDLIGGDGVDFPEFHTSLNIRFLNLRGNQRSNAGLQEKVFRVLRYYARLIRYAAGANPQVFHMLWNNKFEIFDRTLLLLYYKLLGKKIVLTAHNVNAGRRDSRDTMLNRVSLAVQYRLADHIFLHTEKMKRELLEGFCPSEGKVSVIPFGINNSLKTTDLTRFEARTKLGIGDGEKAILFYGTIAPYKGLDSLVDVFLQNAARWPDCRLIVAGRPKAGCEHYLRKIQRAISANKYGSRILESIRYIPDEETELYFKAADVTVLPYREVSQSGVLFLSYSFGLPVIACDVGCLSEDIVEGVTGFLAQPGDHASLAEAIAKYFRSDLYMDLDSRRQDIIDFANARHSWDVVGQRTCEVYLDLLRHQRS